jgi:hypothetical protein
LNTPDHPFHLGLELPDVDRIVLVEALFACPHHIASTLARVEQQRLSSRGWLPDGMTRSNWAIALETVAIGADLNFARRNCRAASPNGNRVLHHRPQYLAQ